ncbi:hypothetical protein Droror1_Dr00004463 [Drosera rotundifolia]
MPMYTASPLTHTEINPLTICLPSHTQTLSQSNLSHRATNGGGLHSLISQNPQVVCSVSVFRPGYYGGYCTGYCTKARVFDVMPRGGVRVSAGSVFRVLMGSCDLVMGNAILA